MFDHEYAALRPTQTSQATERGFEVNWVKAWIHRFLLPLGFSLAAAVLSVLIYGGKIGSVAALLLGLLAVDALWLGWMFSQFSNGQAKKAMRRYEKQVLWAYAPLLTLLAHEAAGATDEDGWVDDEQGYIWPNHNLMSDLINNPKYSYLVGNIHHPSFSFDDS